MSGVRQRPKLRVEESNRLFTADAVDSDHPGNDEEVQWTQDEAQGFFGAFEKHGTDWQQVSKTVGSKDAAQCENLYRQFKSFLSLPSAFLNVTAFLAVFKDSLKQPSAPSEDETVSLQRSGHSPSVAQSEEDEVSQQRPRRSKRAPKALKEKGGESDSPVWGSRRPRARAARPSSANPPSSAFQEEKLGRYSAEADDADGIDALMSLATAAHEASHNQHEEHESGRGSRTVKPSRKNKDDSDEEFKLSPHGNDSSTARRKSAKQGDTRPRQPGRRRQAAQHTTDSRPSGRSNFKSAIGNDGKKAGAKRHREKDDDFVVTTTGKRSRRRPAHGSESPQHTGKSDAEDNELEAEREELDADENQDSDEWARPSIDAQVRHLKRRRKSRPERAPPKMASVNSIFSSRSSMAFGTPPPAFLLGVPPPSAQWSGVETEGQLTMGPVEIKLRHCLDPRVRRWCACEFFCSALDRPWFMRNELAEYLTHVGIPKGSKLARPELCIVRASLGRPRRLSLSYLHEERVKLEAWREHVRKTYKELGPAAELPSNLPRQLQVGMKVTARHPITRQLHDGDILTVGHNSYRVQFARRELSVEHVKDVDVMPINPTQYLPKDTLAAEPHVIMNGRQAGRAKAGVLQPGWLEEKPAINLAAASPVNQLRTALMQSTSPSPVPYSQPSFGPHGPSFGPNSTIKSLSDMRAALNTKEALIARLTQMNDEVDAGLHKEEGGQRPAAFQKAYAQVLVDLQMMNKTLENSPFSRQVSMASIPSSIPTATARPPPPSAATPPPAPSQRQGNSALVGQRSGPSDKQSQLPAGVWDQIQKEALSIVGRVRAASNLKNDMLLEFAKKGGAVPREVESLSGKASVPSTASELQGIGPVDEDLKQKDLNQKYRSSSDNTPVELLVAGCVSLLLTLHECAENKRLPQGGNAHLEKALNLLHPTDRKNLPLYQNVERKLAQLQSYMKELQPARSVL